MPTPADLQRDITRLTGLAQRDLASIWRQVSTAAEAQGALNDILPALIQQYGEASALLAAEWYDDLREQHLDGAPRFSAYPASLGDQGAHALTGWAAKEANSVETMQSLISGGMTRRIADWARETVMGSTFADPRAEGWMRVGRASACAFCRMLVSRGAVYAESTVKFASHDDCTCGAAPKWGGVSDVFDVEDYRRSTRRWRNEHEQTDSAAADDARARAWIEKNLGGAAGRKRADSGSTPQGQSGGFDALTIAQLENQLRILEGLPDSDYKRTQIARVRARLAALRRG